MHIPTVADRISAQINKEFGRPLNVIEHRIIELMSDEMRKEFAQQNPPRLYRDNSVQASRFAEHTRHPITGEDCG